MKTSEAESKWKSIFIIIGFTFVSLLSYINVRFVGDSYKLITANKNPFSNTFVILLLYSI
jgi:hypothetical protein